MDGWRAFLLRRLLGRLRIGGDILRHLSTFQRLGETLEIQPPGEMLPVGARTVLRAVRTQGAVQIRPDWLWPYWLERQLDPQSRSFVPRGHLPFAHNLTHRNWTMVGNPGSSWEVIVDPVGLVTPWFDGWSLDWWVRVDGRWHVPSRADRITQRLVGSAPVVETTIPLEGGAAVHRAYAVSGDATELVVVEVENATGRDAEVAFGLRPYNPEGLAVVETIAVRGPAVSADGRPSLFLPGRPIREAVSTFARGDSALLVMDGRSAPRRSVRDRAGLAQAAFAYRLPARSRTRVLMPVHPRTRRRRGVLARRRPRVPRIDARAVPAPEEVATRWRRRLERGMRVELPDDRLQRAVDANRAYLLLFHDGADITPGPFTYHRFWFRDAAYQLAALDRWGFHREAAEVLRSYPERQNGDGFFYSQWREWDSNGAAIWAIAEHGRLSEDRDLVRSLAPAVRRGAEWIERKVREPRRPDPRLEGLLPPGISAEHLGPFDYYYWDDFWALRGLLDAAGILRGAGDQAAAERRDRAADALREALFRSLDRAARRIGRAVMPAGPTRGIDAGMVGSLAAVWPLRLVSPDDARVTGTIDAIRERFLIGDAFFQEIAHTGLGTYLTLQLAFVELDRADPASWRRFRWLLDAATTTFTWPEAIHPQLGTGCMGDGHHGWAAADFLSFLRNVLVREDGDGLALMTVLPADWEGRRVAVRDAPTHRGRISYELRWGDRGPELEWECERPGVPLRAPGVDPGWSSAERSGRAVLGEERAREPSPRR